MNTLDRTAASGDDGGMERPVAPNFSPPVGGFDLQRRMPTGETAAFVSDIVHYREHTPGLYRQVETASLVVPLVISFGAPFAIALGREPESNETYSSFTSGLFPGHVVIRSTGAAECVQVNFTPLGAWRFFGLPMSELAGRMATLDDIQDRGVAELSLRLGDLPGVESRLDLVTTFVTDRLRRSAVSDAGVEAAYRLMLARHGDLRISKLAARLDWSRKHLADRFQTAIGVPPKTLARIMRFNRATTLARREADWADIAATCGYADQSHLTREFSEFAGTTPSAWLAMAA